MEKRIFISALGSIYDDKCCIREMTFQELCETLKVPQVLKQTEEEYNALPDDEKRQLKFGACFCTCVHNEQGDKPEDLAYILALDVDHPNATLLEDIKARYPDLKVFAYTTFRSREGSPRYRIIIPLSRPVTKDEYEKLCEVFTEKLDCEFDKQCFNFRQKLQFPRVLKGIEYHFCEWGHSACAVDSRRSASAVNFASDSSAPDNVLPRHENFALDKPERDKGCSVTLARHENFALDKPERDKGCSVTLPYCEVHPITEIMESLSDIYEPTDTKNRYKLIGSDSTPGVIIDPDKNIATSFHANDPAQGTHNSFDLYRIHRFGALDKDVPEGTKKKDLPSFKAMMDYVKRDGTVPVHSISRSSLSDAKLLCRGTKVSDAEELGAKLTPEALRLQVNRHGEPKNSTANAVTIVLEDPELSGIKYDSFKQQFIATSSLPWEEKGTLHPRVFTEYDRKALIGYISSTYNIETGNTIDNALARLTFCRSVDPLQEYFKGLTWDGESRVEGLLTKYLGCEDSEYTRAVMRTTLISGVKRVFEPGCKIDMVLVLIGKQGCGKSTFVSRLAKGYFTDTIRCQDIATKTAAEKLRGVFIAEISEMAGFSKTEVEMVKSFFSCQNDNYREPYARIVTEHPRKSIIIGTSNRISGLLIDETGNRRFLPVFTGKESESHPWDMTDEDIDQIWAEAYMLYKNGESHKMPAHLVDEVLKMQNEAVVEDIRMPLVSDYLDILLPENWYDLSIEDRRDYINHTGKYVGEPYEGTLRRDYICAAEIGMEFFNMKKIELSIRFSKEIALMLRKLGWTEYPANNGRKKIPGYGKGTTFCRPASDSGDSSGDRK